MPLRAALPERLAERQGKKVVLVMRVAFKDVSYTPLEAALAETNKSVSELYAVMSRQKLQFDFRILPRIFTTPQNRSVYDGSAEALDRMQSQIDAWVKELQLQRGRDYDYLVVHYPELPQEGAGAFADDKTGDIQVVGFDTYRTNALGHELGHSLGLLHAHAIYAPDIFGTPNSDDNDDEYGNVHDLLGAPRDKPDPHIGVSSKWLLGWLNAQEISEVTRSGVYRVYAHDNVRKPGRLVGLRIPSKNPKYAYWFEYRTKFAVSRTGALVLFEGFRSPPDGSLHLLDMKPTSGTTQVDEFNDAALVPGQSLADKYGDARFKVVAVSAGVPNEDAWVDIEVSIPGTTAVSSDGGMEVGATTPDGGVQDAAADLGAPDTAGNP
ncbi:MAG TPA: hypothetical protein VGF45_23990, partial [Polyangia bacterium]